MTLTVPLSTHHEITFRNTTLYGAGTMTIGLCSCGWTMTGPKAEVYNAAATHDIDQWPLTDDDLHTSL